MRCMSRTRAAALLSLVVPSSAQSPEHPALQSSNSNMPPTSWPQHVWVIQPSAPWSIRQSLGLLIPESKHPEPPTFPELCALHAPVKPMLRHPTGCHQTAGRCPVGRRRENPSGLELFWVGFRV